ncbi:MAG: diguanylate cyclase, partial [Chloroflexi bacterium]|nr:diguanylate cyclase [Chloroflexota bacterium]
TTLRSISEGIIAIDNNGTVTFMNQVAEELTGWTEEEARGEKSADVFNTKDELIKEKDDEGGSNNVQGGPLPSMGAYSNLIAKDGVQIPVEHSSAPIKDDLGNSLGEIIIFQNISERVRAEEQIRHLATHDALTDLPNLHLFHDRLAHAIAKAKRDENIVALLYLDLDGFKQVNDNYGHPYGDIMLKLVGIRLSGHVRASDTVARLGGDEFAIVLEDLNDPEHAGIAAKKILDALADPITFEGVETAISASIGIAIYSIDGEDNETLLKNADIAMYAAKKSGKNKFQFYTSE